MATLLAEGKPRFEGEFVGVQAVKVV